MVAAHMDEIGMMVRDVVDGFVYVHRISGVDNRVMLAQPVMVHGKRALPGIVVAQDDEGAHNGCHQHQNGREGARRGVPGHQEPRLGEFGRRIAFEQQIAVAARAGLRSSPGV